MVIESDPDNSIASSTMLFKVDDAEAVRIDSSLNVRVGTGGTEITGLTNGPNLVVGSASGGEIVAYNKSNSVGAGDFVGAFLFGNDDNAATEDHFAGMWAKAVGAAGSMDIHFSAGKADYEAGTIHMTLNASGNLLVGKTSDLIANVGGTIGAAGYVTATRDGATPLSANRLNSDGDIALFYKDSAPVGSIGSVAGQDIVVGSGSSGLRFLSSGPAIQPRNADGTANNDAIDIGLTGNRFKDLYLSGGAYLGGTGAANKLDDCSDRDWETAQKT